MDAYYSDCFDADPIVKQIDEAVAAIKEALAQPEQEPEPDDFFRMIADRNSKPFSTPQRTWVGLTDDDTFEIGERLGLADVAWVDLMQAIESKLKQKNGYADSD